MKGGGALASLRNAVSERADRDAAVREMLDHVLDCVTVSLKENCEGIAHTGRTLRQLLGPGSEAILPADDRMMPANRLAAALLLWSRKRLLRSQCRLALVNTAKVVEGVNRKLRQKLASRPPPPYPSAAGQRELVYAGTTKLIFRVRPILWAHGSSQPRLFDAAFEPRAEPPAGTPGLAATVGAVLAARKKKKVMGPNHTPLAPSPPPPPLKTLRGGMRNSAEGCTGLHLREEGVRGLEHSAGIRGSVRAVVLAMGASNDVNGAEGVEEEPLGYCDLLDGIRWQRCREIGQPLQEAWGLAVAERLFSSYVKLGLAPDGSVTRYPSELAASRTGLEGLPGCWCPARPPAPRRGRREMRAFLTLLLQQKRIHVDELRRGYKFVASRAGFEGEMLLTKHAMQVLNALRYEKRAHARWQILLEKQLADEAEVECDAVAVASELRGAAGKLEALEKLLIEGLAEYSDPRAALRMHLFNQTADVPLKSQLGNRFVGTAIGDLLGQRFEHLEQPELAPKCLGAGSLFPAPPADAPEDGAEGAAAGGPPPVYWIPAAEAAEELAVDNKELAGFIGALPAMLRNATGSSGGAPVGDPAAYDAQLVIKLERIMSDPSTQWMLTIASCARYAWAAMRKGSESQGAKPPEAASPITKDAPAPQLNAKRHASIKACLGVLIERIRAATPKGALPTDGGTVSALKEELGALEADAQLCKEPNDGDIEQIRTCLEAILALVAAATYAIRHKGYAEAGVDVTEGEGAAAELAVVQRNGRAVRKLREYIGEGLSMSLDVYLVSGLDAASCLSVVGEAVGDVSVEQSDLIRSMYKLLYKRTLDAVMTAPKIPMQAPRKFLAKLVKRKPAVAVSKEAAEAWCVGSTPGEVRGEAAKARAWAKAVVSALDASREAQRSLLEWITYVTLDELRAIQVVLSAPPAGASPILLAEIVATGVGGVARQTLLNKLDGAMVPDSDDPMRLNKAFRLLAGREAAGGASAVAYGLPLRYAEGEEYVRGASGGSSMGEAGAHSLALLDAGQRLRPDGSEFNVVRLHRVFAMQSAAADKAGCLTLERMLDEFVVLTIRSAFFDKASAKADDIGKDELVLRGKSAVLRFLINDGFAALKAKGPEGKKAVEGTQFVQPAMLTADGQTRIVFGAGGRENCGSLSERFRMGEQIKWGPWGNVLSILRVEKPLETHYEWTTFFHVQNYAGMKKLLDGGVTYYMILHNNVPEHKKAPRFLARKFVGAKAVFERLDNEMSRQVGNISVVSPTLSGEKLRDLRARRALVPDLDPLELCNGDANVSPETMAIAQEANQQCLHFGTTLASEAGRLAQGGAEGPKRSVLHFAGRWLPLGEGAGRKGELVICVRETIGWKYNSKPPKKKAGEEEEEEPPSASRCIGMLCREFYVDKVLDEPKPAAPGLAAAWGLHQQRVGKA